MVRSRSRRRESSSPSRKAEDVRAELEALLVEFGNASAVALFKRRAAFAFLERLHPQGFGDVSDRFR